MSHQEIERKFRIDEPYPAELVRLAMVVPGNYIHQGYLFSDATGECRVREIRYRGGVQYFVTVKSGGDVKRDEWEEPVDPWVFQVLWPRTAGRRVEKIRRSCITPDGGVWEVDTYLGALDGLVLVEREFPTLDDATNAVLPKWLDAAVEVTYDPRYKNSLLATKGIPTTGGGLWTTPVGSLPPGIQLVPAPEGPPDPRVAAFSRPTALPCGCIGKCWKDG